MSQAELFTRKFRVMGGPAEVQLAGMQGRDAALLANKLEEEAHRLERKYSRYLADSIVSRINAAAGSNSPVEVDEETASLITFGAQAHEFTRGCFDLSSGVLRRAWDFKSGKMPAPEEVRALLPLVGWGKVEWVSPKIRLTIPGMEIDFGGLVKEYCCDRLQQLVRAHDVGRALINLAGDVAVLSRATDKPWHLGISDPDRPAEALLITELRNGALATSGDYERFMEVGGVRYHHILNPLTGYPEHVFRSVSCIAPSATAAGVVTTAGMIQGEGLLRELGFPVLCVRHDRSVLRIGL